MQQAFIWLALGGLAVILALACYAWILWRRVWQLRATQSRLEAERNQRLAGDINLIAQSLVNGQVPVIEGCIRIKVLLDNYSAPLNDDIDIGVFELVYDATAHIPTHQQWKNLTKAERALHQRHMETLEQKHRDAVHQAARQLSEAL